MKGRYRIPLVIYYCRTTAFGSVIRPSLLWPVWVPKDHHNIIGCPPIQLIESDQKMMPEWIRPKPLQNRIVSERHESTKFSLLRPNHNTMTNATLNHNVLLHTIPSSSSLASWHSIWTAVKSCHRELSIRFHSSESIIRLVNNKKLKSFSMSTQSTLLHPAFILYVNHWN